MALAIVGIAETSNNTGDPATVNFPAGISVGDLLVATMGSSFARTSVPAGWTEIGFQSGSFQSGFAMYKVATSTEVTAGLIQVQLDGNHQSTAYCVAFSGHNSTVSLKFSDRQSSSPASVTSTSQSVAAGSIAIYATHVRAPAGAGAGAHTVDRGTLQDSLNVTSGNTRSASIYTETFASATSGIAPTFTRAGTSSSGHYYVFLEVPELPPAGITGTLDATAPEFQSSADGYLRPDAVLDATAPEFTATSDGAFGPASVLDATLPEFTTDMAGDSFVPGVSGDLASVMPEFEATASGGLDIPGTLDATMPEFTSELTGAAQVDGALDATMPEFEASLSGDATGPGVAGSLTATMPEFTASITGRSNAYPNVTITADRANGRRRGGYGILTVTYPTDSTPTDKEPVRTYAASIPPRTYDTNGQPT